MDNRRIIHVITTIERGGAENAVATLAIAQAKAGREVVIFPLKGKDDLSQFFQQNGVQVLFDGFNRKAFTQIRMLRLLAANETIFHAHLPRAELITRIALMPGNFVLTRHNAESFFPGIYKKISSALSRWVTKRAHVIAISRAVESFLISNKELHNSTKCSVVYYGYKTSTSHSSQIPRQKSYKGIKIGTISRLAPQKNLPLLLEATHQLVMRGYDIESYIAGEGNQRETLIQYAQNLFIDKRLHFVGKISEVRTFLETLDVFVLTSDYEGFGLVLLEAMDAQIPIIASHVSAMPEVLGDKHIGLFPFRSLISLTSKIEQFSREHELRKEVIAYQNKRLKLFTVEAYLENHNSIYAQI